MNMEKVHGDIIDIEYIEQRIDELMAEFTDKYDIDDLRKASQNEFYAALTFIYRNLFKDTNILKDKSFNKNITGCTYNTNNNRYNIDLLYKLLDYYIYLCDIYNKISNLTGFCKLSGINRDTIYDWGKGRIKTATSAYCDFYKKLIESSEYSAAGKVISGDGNKIGVLAYLNHYHSWNCPGISNNSGNNQTLSASELPKLSDSQEIKQIESK